MAKRGGRAAPCGTCACAGWWRWARALVVDRFGPHLIAWAGAVPGDARAQLAQLTSSACVS
eukprot:12965560-Alexandrium_andersonii.AAC.1